MAKRIELTQEEQQLYNELQKLIKKANQRILRLERLTGEKRTFAVKQLYDYLDSNTLKALSGKGRIRLSKEFTFTQMLAIKSATEKFLKEDASKVSGVKELTKKYTELAGKPISYKQADVLYRSGKNYTWIYEYIPKSDFWGTWVPVAKQEGWDVITFSEQIALKINKEIDEELKVDLEALYYYVIGD